jgi:hypothetical protein
VRIFIVTANDIQTVLQVHPFVPFRLVTSDGTSYEIRHPELVLVSVSSAVVGYPTPNDPKTAARYDIVSMFHIVRLEPMPAGATGPSAAGNGSA